MSEGVLIALITTMGVVLVGLFGALAPLLISIWKHSKTAATQATSANDQVSNNHSTNLREENDERHSANVRAIADLRSVVISGQRASNRRFSKIEARLGVVEHTIPTPRSKKK